MKHVNRYGLPDVFVRAVENDPYDNGGSDFSASSISDPARKTALIAKHFHELEVDVSTRVASIIGQGAHHIAERAARPELDICEERFFAKFPVGDKIYKVSAQVDLYERDSCVLYDWKTTKAYAFSKKAGSGQKPEWITQLNVAAEILRRNSLEVRALKIIAMLKDWSKREAGSGSCPHTEVVEVDIPLWSPQMATSYIENRILAHAMAKEILPECSVAETWGGRRCGDYCEAAQVCDQYKESLKTGLINKKQEA